MDRITVIVPHLGPTDMNYTLLKQLLLLKNSNVDLCIMFEDDIQPFINFPFPTMSLGRIMEDQTNTGIVIATTLSAAKIISKLPNLKRKVLYLWDLEFLWHKKDFFDNIEIFNSIELFTRSESYKDAIRNYSNLESKVINNFDIVEMIK